MELAIYADLVSTLKNNDRVILSNRTEFISVTEMLNERNIGFETKTQKEICITNRI